MKPAWLLSLAPLAAATAASGGKDPFVAQVTPFLQRHCIACHDGDYGEAGIDLSVAPPLAAARRRASHWNRVRQVIAAGEMPPADYDPLPTAGERRRFAERLDTLINRVDCAGAPDPGRVTMRRLNIVEYDNSVRDLLGGLDVRPSRLVGLPADEVGNGFDNQGEVLSLSPLLLEKYLEAARLIAERAAAAKPNATLRRLFAEPAAGEPPREAAARALSPLMLKAFRRPPEAIEVQRLAALVEGAVERDAGYRDGIRVALQVVLASPHFLFRVESPPPGGRASPLGPFELATRLSYFLHATGPDDTLLAAAGRDELATDAQVTAQVDRLLAEPGAETLVTRFFAQWLGLTGLEDCSPDPKRFPGWNTRLARAAEEETFRLCRDVLLENRSLLALFDADYTHLNPRLAEHYGVSFLGQDPRQLYINGPGAPRRARRQERSTRGGRYKLERRWVRAPAPHGRRGVLTHASILALTSNPASTSPVKRGNWVLDVVLGDPPPPAPPGVPSLEESAGDSESLSLREQLAIHRENPRCAGCHEQMDAIGLGLENFDAVGRWREEYRGRRIDASGELKGEPFDGPAELLSIIRRQERAIAVNFISRLMTYALGRGLRPVDRCVVTEIADRAEPHKYPTRMLVRQVALSTAFRKHGRGDRSRPPHTTPQASQEPQ